MDHNDGWLAAIVSSCGDGVIGADLQGTIVSWNAGAERLYGYPAGEAVGRPITLLAPPERHAEAQDILERIARGQRVDHFETVRRRKDGSMVQVSITASPVRDGEGRVIGASKIARDITEQVQARERVAAQLARLQLLHHITLAIGAHQDLQGIYATAVDFIDRRMGVDFVAICTIDAERDELHIACLGHQSKAVAARLAPGPDGQLRLPADGLRRWCEGLMLCQNEASTSANAFVRALADRAGLESIAIVPLLTEGEAFALLVAGRQLGQAFDFEDCEFLSQLGAHVSLAARQAELRADLEAACEALEQNQRETAQRHRSSALARMVSGVAHDIDNALVVAHHFTKALLSPQAELAPLQGEQAGHVLRAVDDIGAMTARLRTYALRHHAVQLAQRVQLNEIVPQVMACARARWKDIPPEPGASIEVQSSLDEALPPILGAESEIREALVNLAFNALDAMPHGGRLTLRTERELRADGRPCVRVDVIDTGCGMDKPALERCLDPFFTTKGERGSGMGLPMVQAIARRHHAELNIASHPGRGTTASLRFPAAADAVPPA